VTASAPSLLVKSVTKEVRKELLDHAPVRVR
jgi:hypothetical protein